MSFQRGQAITGFSFTLVSNLDGRSVITTGEAAGLISKDGAAPAALANAISHAGNGVWRVNLTAAEMDAAIVLIQLTHPNAITQSFTIKTDTQLAAIKAKTDTITASTIVTTQAVIESGRHVIIVRGDSYTDDSPRGPLLWTPAEGETWPDLAGATGIFTARNADDAIELTLPAVIDAGEPEIKVPITAADSANLTPTPQIKASKFDVQITLANGSIWTPIRGGDNLRSGGLTVVEDQTR